MNTIKHLAVALLLVAAYAAGSASSVLIDLDHRCANSCSWREYFRLMINGGVTNNDQEVASKLERGMLHSAGFVLLACAAAAYTSGFAINVVLHYVGDGL